MANQPTKYKKFLAGAASATLVATAIVPTALAAEVENAATDFSDVAANHTHYAAIMQAVERGLFDGYKDGTFKPENSIDRKGVAKSLAKYVVSQSEYKTFEEYITANKLVEKVTPFNDVPATHGDAELFNASLIVKDSGIFTGSNNNLMPGNVITRQQMAKVLVNGFGLKDLAGVESEVTDTDKAQAEYVNFINILSENKVTEVTTFNPTGAVKRGQMASFLNRSYDSAHKVVAPETATKVVSVSATNLAQVVVAFDGSVDAATATDVENYTIDGKVIKTATLSEDGKSVTLTLNTTSPNTAFANQTEYELTFSNVKAGAKEISVKEYKFTPVDATLPTVTSVTALGNKTLSVKFSEPVKSANTSNFTIDGKTVVGSTSITGNTVIVKLYSTLENGEHTVAVKDVTDFNDFKSLNVEEKFTVVEDVTAPTISSVVKASFEKVTIKFSEQVDPATVTTSSAYWLQGSSKKYAEGVTQISEDTFEFDFSNNKIQYATDLYITGVKDYSSNTIAADSKVQVNPVIDQTRPEVSSLVYDAATKSFTVKFNKTVDKASAEKAANYVVKNSAGTVVSKFKTPTLNSTNNKEVTVVLVDALTAGSTYTVEVAGVSDNTTLKNVMMPFVKTLTVADVGTPNLSTVVKNATNNTLIVNFSEKMAVSGDGSIVDLAKYFYTKDNGATWKTLPKGSSVNVSPDGKSAIIQIPTNGELVNNIGKLRVQLVKDESNNLLTGLTQEATVDAQTAVTYTGAKATATNKIEVKFSRGLLSNTVNANDFSVSTATKTLNVTGAALKAGDSSTVVLTLAESSELNEDAKSENGATDQVVNVVVSGTATTSTVDGTTVSAGTNQVADGISASVATVTSSPDGTAINVKFNELIETISANNVNTEATDFIITDEDGNVLAPGLVADGYSVSNTGGTDTVEIKFGKVRTGVYSVSLNPRFLEDAASPTKNLVEAVSAADAIDVHVNDTAGPVVGAVTDNQVTNSAVAPTFTEGTATLSKDGAAATAYTSGTSISADGVYVLKVKDANNNVTTINFTIDTALPTFTATKTGANEITVVFNEKVNATDAALVTNYVYDPTGVAPVEPIVSATLQADGKTVKLVTTTAPTTGSTIDATVEDLAGNTSASAVVTLP
jgi:hypothetical protein